MPNQFTVSIWGDEGFSAILSMKSISQILKIIATDTSPPLWNITEHLAFRVFGVNEIVIRGLAFIYFLLTIFFVYKIGAHLWNKKVGMLASILTFFNPFFFIYAFEGRMYSILALGVAASMFFFLKRNWILYVIATLWALYSHHFAIFALFIQGTWFLYEFFFGDKKVAKKMFKAFLIIGVGYLPWMWPLYNQTKMVGGGFWLGTPDLEDLRNLIYEYLAEGNKTLGLKMPLINYPFHKLALYLVFVLLILCNWFKDIKKTIFLISWFLGPILITWVISQKFQSIFFNRYLLYTIPAAMLILVSKGRKFSLIITGVLLLIFILTDIYYFTHPTKLPFKQLAQYVLENKTENDYFINWNSSSHHLWETKFYGINAPIYLTSSNKLPFFVGTALMEKKDLVYEIPEKVNRVGVITSGDIEEIILPNYTEIEVKNFDRLKIVWFIKQ